MPLPDEEIDTQRRKIFCRKATKLESAESRASTSRVLSLLVLPSRPPDASENAPDKRRPGSGLWGGGGGSPGVISANIHGINIPTMAKLMLSL